MKVLFLLVPLLALASACDEDSPPEEPEGIVGELSPTVEAGGWLLKGEEKEYLLLGIQDYRQEPWFKEGARVRVTGEPAEGVVTSYMQGEPFRVKSMEPVE